MSKTLIKDVASVFSGATPSTANADYYDGDIVWFTPKDLADQKVKYISCSARKITQKGLDNCSAVMLPAYTVLLSTRAPIGLISISTTECCTNQGFKSIVCDQSKLLPEYLYYYLKFHIKEIENLGSGTTFKEVSKASIENYGIDVPDIVLQKEICSILGSIDSKITTNNAIISELESMAKDIYDYWFVQFDFPDENGKPYKSSGGKMVWNEELKREIPEGWKVKTINDILGNYPQTQRIPSEEYQLRGDYPIIDQSRNYIAGFTSDSTKILNIKDVLVFGDHTNVCKYVNFPFARGADGTQIITSKEIELSNLLLFQQVVSMPQIEQGYSRHFKFLKQQRIVIPNNKKSVLFDTFVSPLMELRKNALKENYELSSLRDFLLPLLMNGQVKIGDVSD